MRDEDLAEAIRRLPATPIVLDVLRRAAPDLRTIPQTTYTLYRQFEHTGERHRPLLLRPPAWQTIAAPTNGKASSPAWR